MPQTLLQTHILQICKQCRACGDTICRAHLARRQHQSILASSNAHCKLLRRAANHPARTHHAVIELRCLIGSGAPLHRVSAPLHTVVLKGRGGISDAAISDGLGKPSPLLCCSARIVTKPLPRTHQCDLLSGLVKSNLAHSTATATYPCDIDGKVCTVTMWQTETQYVSRIDNQATTNRRSLKEVSLESNQKAILHPRNVGVRDFPLHMHHLLHPPSLSKHGMHTRTHTHTTNCNLQPASTFTK